VLLKSTWKFSLWFKLSKVKC